MSIFSSLERMPPDPIFGLDAQFQADPRPHKVNLSVGAFKNAALKTVISEAVKKAEKILWDEEETKSYLPMDGDPLFREGITKLCFGDQTKGVYAAQSLGGTGALRIGGELLVRSGYKGKIFVSDPTWPNHHGIFRQCGLEVCKYPYYDRKTQSIAYKEFLDLISKLPPYTPIVLHAVCHNPTGADFTQDQWREICTICKKNGLIPFFDCAYQGFGSGIEDDAYAMRHFAEEGLEFLVAYSCSKNFTLYGERVGALFVVSPEEKVMGNVKVLMRTNYSNPPIHGAVVVGRILSDASLKEKWIAEVDQMRNRIIAMRERLIEGLGANFNFLKERKGMFCFSGLDETAVDRIIKEKGIYMTRDGRINVAGLNDQNLAYVIEAILEEI